MTSIDRIAAIRDVFNNADTRLQEENEYATYARVVAIHSRSKNRMTKCVQTVVANDSIKADKSITLMCLRVRKCDGCKSP